CANRRAPQPPSPISAKSTSTRMAAGPDCAPLPARPSTRCAAPSASPGRPSSRRCRHPPEPRLWCLKLRMARKPLIINVIQIETAEVRSGESRNDCVFSEAAGSGDGGAAGAGEVVAISPSDTFNDAELAETGEVSGESWRWGLDDQRDEVGAAEGADVKAGTGEGGKESLLGTAEEVEALDGAAFDGTGSGKTVERSDASREVVQSGEVFDIAAVATEQDVTEVGKAVNVLFDGSEGVACWTLLMF